MAWVLAGMGRWHEARRYAHRAARYGTQDPELQFHAGVIAWHADRLRGTTHLHAALAADPHFHPFYADDARAYAVYERLRSAVRSLSRSMSWRGRLRPAVFWSHPVLLGTALLAFTSGCATPSTPTTSARSTTSRASCARGTEAARSWVFLLARPLDGRRGAYARDRRWGDVREGSSARVHALGALVGTSVSAAFLVDRSRRSISSCSSTSSPRSLALGAANRSKKRASAPCSIVAACWDALSSAAQAGRSQLEDVSGRTALRAWIRHRDGGRAAGNRRG